MRSVVILRAVKGPRSGRVFEFDRHDIFVFGRSEECQCSIPDDPYISSNHFLLEVNPPDVELRDLGSKNGTHVNGEKAGSREKGETPGEGAAKAKTVPLKRGDVIKAGKTEFEVQVKVFEECVRCGRETQTDTPHDETKGRFLCPACSAVKPESPSPAPAAKAEGHLSRFMAGALSPERAEAGPRFPGYEVERELRSGGMGRVYLCRRVSDGRLVAVKSIKTRGSRAMVRQIELFKREMAVAMSLRHPNIVEFLDGGDAGTAGVFFAMEYCDAGSVTDLLDKKGPLKLSEAGPIMLQALQGLAFAHSKDFVHRDLKPHNILLHGLGEERTAKVADFGLAKNFTLAGLSGMTASGQGGGTMVFSPKEQLRDFRSVRPVSDVFSMGATLYHMLTGKFVYDLSVERDLCAAILKDRLIPIRKRKDDLPEEVADAVDKATAPDLRQRFQTAGEFRDALAEALKKA
ncbi:MAG: protein kinase [Elusimicrobia bacterium]|nr:protein kinase [Elusimicrobiota bacterium]